MAGPMQNQSNPGSQHYTIMHQQSEHSHEMFPNPQQTMGPACPFSSHQVTQSSTASRSVLSIILSILDSCGSNLQVPFEEARECPMMRCVKKDRFKTPFDLINHLRVCAEARTGEVRCSTCETWHSMKKKGHTHQLLKSPMTILQRRWSVRKNAKQNRNAGPISAPNTNHALEAEAAEESDSSSGTDMPQMLHSEPLRFELQDPNNYFHEADAGCEKQPRAQVPFHGQTSENFYFPNTAQSNFVAPKHNQPPMKQSWSDNSQHSTLFENSPVQDVQKQLSIDAMSFQSSNGSYPVPPQYVHGGQMSVPNNDPWFSNAFSGSPEDVEPSAHGRAPWQGQADRGQAAIYNAADQIGMQTNQDMTPRPDNPASLPSAAAEAARNQLRRQMGAGIAIAPASAPAGAFSSQAQRRELFPYGVGNNSCDSYDSNVPDEMVIGRSIGRSMTSETMSAFTENTSYHEHMAGELAPAGNSAARVSESRNPRQRAAKVASGSGVGLPVTQRDKLVCPHDGCNYQPTGKVTKNYRAHFKRHLQTHDVTAMTPCPVAGCTKTFSGARDDNLSAHVREKHKNTVFETTPSAGRLNFKRPPKRKNLQRDEESHNGDWPYGEGFDTTRSRGPSRRVTGDHNNNPGGVGVAGTGNDLMGISGHININSNLPPAEGGDNGLPAAQDSEDILLNQTVSGNMGRPNILPYNPWNDGQQSSLYGGYNNELRF